MAWNQVKVDQWYQENLSRGANKAQLDAIVQQKQADYVVSQGVPAKELETDPIGLRGQAQEIATRGYAGARKPTLKGTPATQMGLLKGVIGSAGKAGETHQKKYTGILDALRGTGRIMLGGKESVQEEVKFRQNIADVRTSIRKYISGAAISPWEAKEFSNLIPKVTDSDQEILGKIAGLQEISKRKAQDVLSIAGHDISIEEYLGDARAKITPSGQKVGRFTIEVE